MYEIVSPSEVAYEGPLPVLEVDPYFVNDACPYKLEFDVLKFAKLLQSMDVPPEKIESLKIRLKSGKGKILFGLLGSANGKFNTLTGSLTFYPAHHYRIYQELSELARKVVEGEKKPNNKAFKSLLTTQRLGEYLARKDAPAERKMKFANELLHRALEKKYFNVAAHEAKHKIDKDTQPLQFRLKSLFDVMVAESGIALPFALEKVAQLIFQSEKVFPMEIKLMEMFQGCLMTLSLSYIISPVEKSANKFAKDMTTGHFDEWNVIHFQPKVKTEVVNKVN